MRRFVKRLLLGVMLALLALAGYLTIIIQTGNVHEVVAGEFYRSGQLTGDGLADYVKKHHIASVINLRGENVGTPWYDEEVAAAKKLGINHINFRMKASRELTPEQVDQLIDVMKHAPKPVLVHCNAGADRTGLASALYVGHVAHRSDAEVKRQLSLVYGHVPLWFRESSAMRRTLEREMGAPQPLAP